MVETLTIVEHETFFVATKRDISKKTISIEDREEILTITHTNRFNKPKQVFAYKGNREIKAKSIVGSISLKSGLIIEILPKFAKGDLTDETIVKYRKNLLRMIQVSNEKNFISSTLQSSKISVGEMPIIRYMIELFSESLLHSLRNGMVTTYNKTVENSPYIRGNILVTKTIQNNFIDKSKVYISYNKHSSNNLLMQIFKTLSKLLLNDTNLSYRAKQYLYEVYVLLDSVEILPLKQHHFDKVIFNRLNDKFETLFKQAEFIFNQYMPFTSNINSTPFWAILFNMNYLFEKFCAYLLQRSNIEINEQSKVNCYLDGTKTVIMKPDFLLFEKDKIISVVDAKWKLLERKDKLYGLDTQNFWQLFSYMNLVEDEEVNGYFIVPKNSNEFDDEIIFDPIKNGSKPIRIFSIDFSLEFDEILERYRFTLKSDCLRIDIQEKKELIVEDEEIFEEKEKIIMPSIDIKKEEFQFDFEKFIDELSSLSLMTKKLKGNIQLKNKNKNKKFPNLFYMANKQKINQGAFKILRDTNIDISELSWHIKNIEIKEIPKNITNLWRLKTLNLNNKNITLPHILLEISSLQRLIIDEKIVEDNIEILKELKEKGITIEDAEGNELVQTSIPIKEPKKIDKKEKSIESIEPSKNPSIMTTQIYSKMTKKEKLSFLYNCDFNIISKDIIELIMQEIDIDILEGFTYNLTLPLRFGFSIYNNNLEKDISNLKLLKDNLLEHNNKILNLLLNLNLESQKNYIQENFKKIDKDILLGYAMTSLNDFYRIKEVISKNSEDLDILNELSKHRTDRPILNNIIRKTTGNELFTRKIKNKNTIYSTEILNRIAHYDEHPTLQRLLLGNYNITDETKEYLETQVEYEEQNYSEYIDDPFHSISDKWTDR
jgi:5-methylcytosine-specific restriction endonuclease McrBC regulatory subunit McrC